MQGHHPSHPGFWPPGPPAFHQDKSIQNQADQLYSRVLQRYKQLARLPYEQVGDPWYGREAWRYHPYFSQVNVWKRAAPGFGWALMAFTAYCAYEKLYMKPAGTH